MSVTIAERFHAWRCRSSASNPTLVSSHSGGGPELVEVLDHEQRAHARVGGLRVREAGCEHLAVVVGGDVAGDAEADRAGGHVVDALDHAFPPAYGA